MSNALNLNRRRLMQLAGLGGGLFLPSLLGDRQAQAQGAPKRLVLFWTQHGPVSGLWEMTRPGLPTGDAAEWEFPLDNADPMSFTETLRPLHAHRKDLLLLEGLSLTTCMFDEPYNNHGQGRAHIFNGDFRNNASPSVDQIIGDAYFPAGGFKSLFYTSGYGGANGPRIIGSGGGARLPAGSLYPQSALSAAYTRLFASVPAGGGTPAPVGPPSPSELSRLRRGGVLGVVKNQYDVVSKRLGAEDRAKLARHRDMIADLERQISVVPQMRLGCTKPSAPSSIASEYTSGMTAMSKLFPIAMACDLTRVVVMEHGELATGEFGAPATKEVHADYAHSSGSSATSTVKKSVPNPGPAANAMVGYYNAHAKQFAAMIEAFRSVPEGNGTMLDNSILVWMPELSNGWHDYHKYFAVMAGGGGGSFRTGRYLKYRDDGPDPSAVGGWAPTSTGPAHNKLLVSLMQAMGVNRNSIGQTSATGLRYKKGEKIDLTGPLPRLA